jgi:hypothetical protein
MALIIAAGCATQLETRAYRSQDMVQYFARLQHSNSPLAAPPGDGRDLVTWTRDLLSDLGVKWEPGSVFVMDTNSFVVTVRNTPKQLAVFEAIVTTSDIEGWPKMERLK